MVMGSNHKITARKRNKINKVAYRLQIGSKEMFNSSCPPECRRFIPGIINDEL